ncbi:MAG: RluA family pseudouridine synthase [Microcoleaceae cyanobacterium]
MTEDNQINLVVNAAPNSRLKRLDLWLSQQLSDLSRSRIQTLIAQDQVYINSQICKSKKAEVKLGDRIRVIIPETQPLELTPVEMELDILYEDEHLIIINKPAGLVVHPSAGHEDYSLVHGLLAHCDNLAGIGGVERPGIVHRLDKDTTGAIVVAKTDFTLQHLQAQIQAKTARRQYLGVVYGAPENNSGTINQPMGRHLTDRKKMAVIPIEKAGKNAITHWQVEERLGNYTLMQFILETGRTHQIRVHSAFIGHPLVGDLDYSKGRSVKVNLPGQALHAWKLTLEHPISGKMIEAVAPLPETMNTLLNVLRRRL